MRQIPVKFKGGGVEHALVDDIDYDRINQWSWRLDRGGYAVRTTRRLDPSLGRSRTFHHSMHREVLGARADDPPVDHINGNRLDCRRENLRFITAQGNSENRRPNRRSRSGVRGVSWNSRRQKWQVSVGLHGRLHYLGLFATVEEAGAVAAAFRARHMPASADARAL